MSRSVMVVALVGYFAVVGLMVWKLFEIGHPVWACLLGAMLLSIRISDGKEPK